MSSGTLVVQCPTSSGLGPGEIWKLFIRVYDTYNSARSAPDAHVDEFLKEHKEIEDPNDKSFLHQLMYGMLRYEKFIGIVVEKFYEHNHAAVPNDRISYLMITYLALLRLGEELSLSNLRKILRGTLDQSKLYTFLRFLWNHKHVEELFIPQWEHIYERDWIETKIVCNMDIHRDEMNSYISDLERVSLGKNEEKKVFKPVVPEPFNLTKPQPKRIPEPEVITTTFKRKEVPMSTYQCDPQAEQILRDFKEGKTRITKYEVKRAKEDRPSPRPPSVTERVPVKDIETVKEMLNKPATVKLNVAAILREDAIYRKKQEKEVGLLKQFEEELRDASDFHQWQDEMKGKDEKERQILIEKRKLEAMLTDERAKRAKIKQTKENKKAVGIIREKKEMEMKQQRIKDEEEAKLRKKQAEELSEQQKEAVAQAKQALSSKKVVSATEVREKRKENEILVAERLEIERQRKEELIRQIRAMEAIPSTENVTTFDPTEQPTSGLMIEMSYAELQARLKHLREKQNVEEEERRQDIINRKREKENEIMEKAKKIAQYRQQAKKENVKLKEKRIQTQQIQQEKAKETNDSKLLELHEKLMAEKNERRREMRERAQEARQRNVQQQFLGADRLGSEQKRWEQLEKGLEREIKVRAEIKAGEKANKLLIQSQKV